MAYKRIITVDGDKSSALLREAFDPLHGTLARPARCGVIGEYVIEVPDAPAWRKIADQLADKYDNGK